MHPMPEDEPKSVIRELDPKLRRKIVSTFDPGFCTRPVHPMGDDPRVAGSVPNQCECLAFPITTGCQRPFAVFWMMGHLWFLAGALIWRNPAFRRAVFHRTLEGDCVIASGVKLKSR